MSFTSGEFAVIDLPCEVCFNVLSDSALFIEFMGLSDITTNVKITSTDKVLLSPALELVELESRTVVHESYETCRRINFELTENVTYLGLAKEIPVIGRLIISNKQKLHVEHREASGGLVITDKIRRFQAITSESAEQALTSATKDQQVDSGSAVKECENKNDFRTKIVEEIDGSTSWYLKFFVELEARRSHKAIVQHYADYLAGKHVS